MSQPGMGGAPARAPAVIGVIGLIAVITVIAMTLTGCAYRAKSPTALDETVAVTVRSANLRLPRAAVLTQERVANAIAQELGWRVRGDGSAQLVLEFTDEAVNRSASDRRDLPLRHSIAVHGRATLHCRHGTYTTPFTGTGDTGGLSDEDQALDQVATSVAANLIGWLDGLRWRDQSDPTCATRAALIP